MDAQRVIVLGGSGWLGSHLVELLRETDRRVTAVSRGARSPGLAAAESDSVMPVDLGNCSDARLDELVDGADVVVNSTDGMNARDGRTRNAHDLRTINHLLVERLTRAIHRSSRRPLLLHMGSILEYGPPPGRACSETDHCSPGSDYARSKLLGTTAALAARERGHEVVVLRLANLIGPRPAQTTFPGIVTSKLRRAQQMRTPASLTVTADRRDFLDVRDAASAALAVIDQFGQASAGAPAAPAAVGDGLPALLNISSGRTVPIPEIVASLLQTADLDPALVDITRKQIPSAGGGMTWADPRLAQSVLKWRPLRPLDESLNDMWTSTLAWPNSGHVD